MPPLITVRRDPQAAVNDVLWPTVSGDLLIRLDPDEVIRWRGLAYVAETRWDGQRDSPWQRIWKVPEPADCLITDRRLTYRVNKIERGTGQLATIADSLKVPTDGPPWVLAGQVRFQWPAVVILAATHQHAGIPARTLTLLCEDRDIAVRIILEMTEKTSGPHAERIAEDVAKGLVSDIARFRLATRADRLGEDRIRQLTMQRDSPMPVVRGSSLHWKLEGGLLIGQPPNKTVYQQTVGKRLDALYDEGVAAMQRYDARGEEKDLENTLAIARSLLREVIPYSEDELAYLNLHAGALMARYQRFGDLSDLTSVIDVMRVNAERTKTEAPKWMPDAYSNLSSALIERWHRALDPQDLEEGVTAAKAAVAATDPDSPEWVSRTSNLGLALRAQYMLTRNMADLDRAVELYEEILTRFPAELPDRADYLANLGNTLFFRHRVNDSPQDLAAAISAYQEALRLMPREAVHRVTVQMAFADAMARLDERSGDKAALDAAVAAWRQSCADGQATSQARVLQAATNWSEAMARRGDWALAVEACGFGLAAADRLFRMQLVREHKTLWLEHVAELPARAAYALAKMGDLKQAAVTLEHGRAVLLSEILERDHADLNRLTSLGRDDLRVRYRQAADRIANLERAADQQEEGAASSSLAGASSDELIEALRAARTELDQAIAAIRATPGYETFLAHLSYSEIAATATEAPLAYLVSTEVGGLALLVDGRTDCSTEPTAIWLDELNEATMTAIVDEYLQAYDQQANQQGDSRRWPRALASVTRRLWDVAMGPLLAKLPADRVTLIPGGFLGILPLHAAWAEDTSTPTGRRYSMDNVLITYTPSALALRIASQEAPHRAPDAILAVSDSSLANAEAETRAALSWFSQHEHLRRDQATRQDVRAALAHSSVLHFSCHGSARVADPLLSSLHAARDGDLTLQDLLDAHLPRARLAVLSACETALIGANALDEMIGLPTGLLQAGAPGVVASLWLVGDAETATLMAKFYELWQGDGLPPAQALRRAQQWVRDSTIQAKKGDFPDIVRPDDANLPVESLADKHPIHWAAFMFVGV
jgi:CHAT domain-containing protein